MNTHGDERRTAIVLSILTLAFFFRVVGQLMVAVFEVSFLPPMDEWYSGFIPYPILLPIQIAILAAQFSISRDVWSGTRFFAARRPRFGRFLCRFSYVYFAVMAARYVVTMWLYPDRRWLHGTIPIVFHWVLAGLFIRARQILPFGKRIVFDASDRRGSNAA